MSGYFAALMRSSGLSSPALAPERPLSFERVDAVPAAAVLAPPRVLGPLPSALDRQPTQQQTGTALDRQLTQQQTGTVESQGPTLVDKPAATPLDARPAAAIDPVPAPTVPLRAAAEPVDIAKPLPPARASVVARAEPPDSGVSRSMPGATTPTDALPTGLDLMRAARRWVAADPGLPAPGVGFEAPVEPRLVVQERIVAAPLETKRRPSETVQQLGLLPSEPAGQRSPEAPALRITPASFAHAVIEPAPHKTQPASPRPNDSVEVSIGTICVKVDAPSPPPPLPLSAPAAGPAPERMAARPALARRSLRRI